MPDGVYETVDWNEFDGHDGPDRLLELRLRLEVDGSDLRFFYTGVPQIDAFVNSTEGPMFGQAMTGLMTLMVYGDLPVNGGLWRPITVDIGEPGTIVNSQPPAPVSNAHSEVGMRACKMAKDVLCQAMSLSDDPELRGRVAGQHQDGFPGNALFGVNQHGGISVVFYPDNAIGSGGGAQTINDGQDAYGLTCTTGGGIPDIENHEGADPVLFLWRKLLPNSGGPGQNRGGQSLEQAYVVHYSDRMAGPCFNACAQVPPHGFGGGYPGSAGNFYPIRGSNVAELIDADTLPTLDRVEGRTEVVRSKITHIALGRGDVFVGTSGGGAGLGDPLFRAPERVLEDVVAGYVTVGHADRVYGVVLDGDDGLDHEATLARRAEIRRERIGGEPQPRGGAAAEPRHLARAGQRHVDVRIVRRGPRRVRRQLARRGGAAREADRRALRGARDAGARPARGAAGPHARVLLPRLRDEPRDRRRDRGPRGPSRRLPAARDRRRLTVRAGRRGVATPRRPVRCAVACLPPGRPTGRRECAESRSHTAGTGPNRLADRGPSELYFSGRPTGR